MLNFIELKLDSKYVLFPFLSFLTKNSRITALLFSLLIGLGSKLLWFGRALQEFFNFLGLWLGELPTEFELLRHVGICMLTNNPCLAFSYLCRLSSCFSSDLLY